MATAAEVVERGARFLLGRQGGDGLWRDFRTPAGEASQWPTGFVATALAGAGASASALERAAVRLVATQHADGGWGYHEGVPTDADSTAGVLLFLAGQASGADACRRATACLGGHQRAADGGVATYSEPGPIREFMGVGQWMRFDGWCSPQTEVTALAGRALKAFAGDLGSAEAEAAWRFVRSRQRDDGSWGSYWWTSPHYATLQGAQLALSCGDDDAAGRAAEWAAREQGQDGGWSAPGARTSAFTTALSLSVLRCVGVTGRRVDRAVERLAALQHEDGGWPSHPVMRVPLPATTDPDRRRRLHSRLFGGGLVVGDQHRTFTSAACVTALAGAPLVAGRTVPGN